MGHKENPFPKATKTKNTEQWINKGDKHRNRWKTRRTLRPTPDPQKCRVRSLGRRRGGTQKQTTHQGTKTKLSSATPNRDKTIHCQRKHRKSIPPTMSQRNQHLTHAMLRKPATTTPKQFQTIWFMDSKKWSSPVALKVCCLNKTQLWFTCVM